MSSAYEKEMSSREAAMEGIYKYEKDCSECRFNKLEWDSDRRMFLCRSDSHCSVTIWMSDIVSVIEGVERDVARLKSVFGMLRLEIGKKKEKKDEEA